MKLLTERGHSFNTAAEDEFARGTKGLAMDVSIQTAMSLYTTRRATGIVLDSVDGVSHTASLLRGRRASSRHQPHALTGDGDSDRGSAGHGASEETTTGAHN